MLLQRKEDRQGTGTGESVVQEMRRAGQGREAGYKLTVGLDTRIDKLVREISGPCINSDELTTIWVG